jgi:hypothetical protein
VDDPEEPLEPHAATPSSRTVPISVDTAGFSFWPIFHPRGGGRGPPAPGATIYAGLISAVYRAQEEVTTTDNRPLMSIPAPGGAGSGAGGEAVEKGLSLNEAGSVVFGCVELKAPVGLRGRFVSAPQR